MLTCIICHLSVQLDDRVVGRGPGHCLCLRCYRREVGDARPVPGLLRREVAAALASCGPW